MPSANPMHARHGQRPISHGEPDALRAARADITAGQQSRKRRFQRRGIAILQWPAIRALGVDSGKQIAVLITRNRIGQPCRVRLGTDEHEDRIDIDLRRSSIAVDEIDRFDATLPVNLRDLRTGVNGDVPGGTDAVGQVIAHAGAKLVATD